jgi:hypothetical protein
MSRVFACAVVLLAAASAASAETPLQQFLGPRGYKARLNPGSWSLVGDIYPDRNSVGTGRVFKLAECRFDGSIVVDGPEALENSTDVVAYDTADVSLLLNIAKRNPANAAADIASLEAAFAANHVRFVSLRATDLIHVGVSTGPIADAADRGPCSRALKQTRDYLVTDAIGATTLTYDFLDENQRHLSAGVTALAGLLFKVGLSRSQTTMGSATFSQPVFIGFALSQWDPGSGEFRRVR